MDVLNRIWRFLRSMKFGIALLLIICALSVVGTIIPQGRALDWYATQYPSQHETILTLGLNRLYQSWYFVGLLALLSLNLALCTFTRLRMLLRTEKTEATQAARLPVAQKLTPEQAEAVRSYLKAHRCTERTVEGETLFTKHHFGRYGTFLTHLGILLTVLFGAAALYLPTVQDVFCLPGESVVLEDGTEIFVEDFDLVDAEGKLDYASRLRVKLPDGRESGTSRISVNHPLSYGPYKIYQQMYGVAGSITVYDAETDTEETFVLTDEAVLTKDGVNGVIYQGVAALADVESGTFGQYMPETDQTPIYLLQISERGSLRPSYGLAGLSLQVGDLTYYINDPVAYPGLEIKHTPHAANALLIAAFVVLTIGLYITFFLQPVLVKVTPEGYTVAGTKPEGMRMELEQMLVEESEKRTKENDAT